MGVESNLRTSGVKENFDCLTQKKKKKIKKIFALPKGVQ